MAFAPVGSGNATNIEAELLDIYLADHRAGSTGGVSLARRIARENSDNDIGAAMTGIAMAIEEDQGSLELLMDRLDVRGRIGRQVGAKLGELAMRLKLNGKLLRYSPLSRVLELEAMIMGVTGKLQLWRSLLAIDETDPRLDRSEIERLRDRAEDQRSRLEELHRRAASNAFSGEGSPRASESTATLTR